MKSILLLAILSTSMLLLTTNSVQACRAFVPPPEILVQEADVIVRATADSYDKAPEGNIQTTGIPESTIKFKVAETLKGEISELILINGYLTDKDDYNDVSVPYRFVRKGGRSGSCFANSYKEGADFLLFLKKRDGKLTVYWRALAPVNEQLRSNDDEWLLWVKNQLKTTQDKADFCICPTFSVKASNTNPKAGIELTFSVQWVNGEFSDVRYNWTLSKGKIIGGQGTSTIRVGTKPEMECEELIATVELRSKTYCRNCSLSESEAVHFQCKNSKKK
jgi:hypothetical protein